MEFNLNFENIIISEIKEVLINILKKKIYNHYLDVNIKCYTTKEPTKLTEETKRLLKDINVGDKWGELFDCAWFEITCNNISEQDVYLHLDINGEALLYDNELKPLKGFTNGSSAFDRDLGYPGKEYYNISNLVVNNKLLVYVEAGCNDLFGNLQENGKIKYAEVMIKNYDIEELYNNVEVLVELLTNIKYDDYRYRDLFNSLIEIKNLALYENDGWLEKSLKLSYKLLDTPSNSKIEVMAVGHSHLDLAWLWPVRESKRKAIRTLTNVFYLLEKDPNFIFVISQPQQLAWVKELSSEVYEKVKKYVQEGRIELVGGMWVEADTNVTGEEALVRQCLYGLRYYESEFGKNITNLWLPDVFGYNGSLPQIIKKSGMDYFMTTKLSWNLINKFPFSTIIWKGIDGTDVLSHMPPEGTYNSAISPKSLLRIENNYHQVEENCNVLALFGIGDGAGGPGEEHINRVCKEASLFDLPKVKYGTVEDFFNKLNTTKDKYPIWNGELYLENHQGTYTSQSNIKRNNRLIEEKLKAVEEILVFTNTFEKYKHQLDEIWKEVLLYQFHDILPGSSIKRVYDEAMARYQLINEKLDKMIESCNKYNGSNYRYNPNYHTLKSFEFINDKLYIVTTLPMSSKIESVKTLNITLKKIPSYIEMSKYNLGFDDNGRISEVYDKNTNNVVHSINKLLVYKDFGNGWDIPYHYREQIPIELIPTKVYYEDYDNVKVIYYQYIFDKSTIDEKVIVDCENDLIIFNHKVNWQNLFYMLKCRNTSIIKTDSATCDIQFGHLSRIRKNETNIEKAQIEVCAQKWVNIQDKDQSLTLYNNAKYGHYIKGDAIELTLLTSTNYPCENGDIGETEYNYAISFRKGNEEFSDIDIFGDLFNNPAIYLNKEIENNLFKYDNKNIKVSAIKGAYDGNGIIVRFSERSGKPQHMDLETFGKTIIETNLIEKDIQKSLNSIDFKPFEIKTFRLIDD